MGRPKDPNSLRSLGEKYGVSAKTVGEWREAGCNVADADEVAAFRSRLSGEDRSDDAAGGTITEARRRKLELESILLEMKIAAEERRLIPVAEVNERDLRTGSLVKAMFMRIASDLPAMVVGLPVEEIEEVMGEWAYERLREVAAEDSGKFEE